MNNKIFTLFIAALMVSNVSFAKIIRVGYTGPQITGVDFTEAQLAHDAASAGDTLLFSPGSYGISSATKKLVYIGTGYFTDGKNSNPNLQLIGGSIILTCYLSASASGSVFEGIETLTAISLEQENVNDIIIRRCKGGAAYMNSASTSNNWHFLQCFDMQIGGGSGDFTNLRVENSKVSLVLNAKKNTGQFTNCFFQNLILDLNDNTLSFLNCIFSIYTYYTPSKFTNSIFQNCLFNIADPGLSGSNNKFSVEFFDTGIGYNNYVFKGWPVEVTGQTADEKYKLKAGSPAIGAGIGGVDMGIYGGANPYRLSGIPSIPAFYKLTAPSNNATTNPYTITFSVRSNN